MSNGIDKINKELEVNEIVKSTIEIKYKPAKFFRRLMANLLDFIIFIFVAFLLFLGSRSIIATTDSYKNAYNSYRNEQLASSLYYDDKSMSYPSITNYIDESNMYTHEGKHHQSQNAVINFYTYMYDISDSDVRNLLEKQYKNYFSKTTLKDNDGNLLFTEIKFEDNKVIISENSECRHADFYNIGYKPFINDYLLSFFGNYSENYKVNVAYVGKMIVLIAIPVSFTLSAVLTYLIPPLCFRRGRKTLGKALYKIGLVDPRYLNVTWKRYLIRFAIFFFGELVLSIFTFAIPVIFSFSMMAFSKKKQGFPDYMLGCREVDLTSNKIYYSLEEINLSQINPTNKPVDFKLRKEL